MLFPLKLLHYHHLRWRVALSHQKPFNIHVVCVSLRSNKSHLIIGRPEEQRMPFTAAYQINQQWCAPWMKRFNKQTFVCHWTVRKLLLDPPHILIHSQHLHWHDCFWTPTIHKIYKRNSNFTGKWWNAEFRERRINREKNHYTRMPFSNANVKTLSVYAEMWVASLENRS